MERKSKNASLIKDADYDGNDEKLIQRLVVHCYSH